MYVAAYSFVYPALFHLPFLRIPASIVQLGNGGLFDPGVALKSRAE